MNLWRILELSPPAAAALAWRQWLGPESQAAAAACLKQTQRRTDRVPCPHGCGCGHRVVAAGDRLLAVCDCEEGDCEDLLLREADRVVWEVDLAKLGRGVARAFGVDPKDSSTGLEGVRQIGSFSAVALPILLTVPRNPLALRTLTAHLVAKLKHPFALLAPTGQFLDAEAQGLLASVGAGFFALESHLQMLESGLLRASKSAGELFSALLPKSGEDASTEEEARKLYALLKACQSEPGMRKAPLYRVYELYCKKGLSAKDVARELKCSKTVVIARLASLKQKTGVSPDKLRDFTPLFEHIEASLDDPRAQRIRRRAAIYGEDPEDQD